MRTKSIINLLFQRLALLVAILAACFAQNATAQNRPFINISTRAEVLNGENIIIAGFIIQTTGSATKTVLIRGMGPSYGLSLVDPTITLHGPNGVIHGNNNWKDTQQTAIQATGFQPGNDMESAILWTLPAGSYTVTLGGHNGATGVGLVELYDMGGMAPIVNLSSRARVGTGNNVMIGGVYVLHNTRAVVRAIGPTLANYGVQGALADPVLELFNGQGALMMSNDNWPSDPQSPEIQRLGLAPGNGLESAILPTFAPGPYTVVVKGANNGTGIGMVELYALDAEYPRVFQAWADADYNNEDPNVTVARHDLFWTTLNGFGLHWEWEGNLFGDDYRSEKLNYIGTAQAYDLPTIRALNPKIKILGQIQHYAASRDTGPEHLPSDHTWWLKVNGQFVPDPLDPSRFLLDHCDPELRAHVANQAKALMDTGRVEGIMLDSCDTGTPCLDYLLADIRAKIGDNALIIVNVNYHKLTPSELNKINGVFMESGKIGTGTGGYPSWATVRDALDHNELHVRSPKINSLENWYSTSPTSPADLQRMRATTALSLTHSNGYVLFGDSGHFHTWYPFWSNHSLGLPIGNWFLAHTYGHRREFSKGSVVWNPGPSQITVTFTEPRTNVATGQRTTSFILPVNDGGIYVY
jgi:hypothetical protein